MQKTVQGTCIEVMAAFYSIDSTVRGYNTHSDPEVELDCSQVMQPVM